MSEDIFALPGELDAIASSLPSTPQSPLRQLAEMLPSPLSPMLAGSNSADVNVPAPENSGLSSGANFGAISGAEITPGTITSGNIAPDAINFEHLGVDLAATPRTAGALPNLPDALYPVGTFLYNTTDKYLYKTDDGNTWTALTNVSQIVGQITTGQIAAGSITASMLASVIVLAALIKTADAGARIEFSNTGFRVYSSAGAVLINFPTDGTANQFIAEVIATVLTVTGNAEFRGTANAFTKESVTTLGSGFVAPNAAPTLSQALGLDTLAEPASYTSSHGMTYDAVGGVSGTQPCYICMVLDSVAGKAYVVEWNVTTKAIDRSTEIVGLYAAYPIIGYLTRIGLYWYITVSDGAGVTSIVKVTRSTGVIASTTDISSRFATCAYKLPIRTDATNLYVLGPSSSVGGSFRVVKFDATPAYVSTVEITTP